jgi:non-ribosomal peptide synthetase-like protein
MATDVRAVSIDAGAAGSIVQADPAAVGPGFLTCTRFDNSVRWQNGDRLEHLFERRCDELRRQGRDDHLAVDGWDISLSYAQLDARSNQLARFLIRQGVRPDDRVGLLFDRAALGYIGMLAVLKAHASYVPLDTGFPPDRLSYIVQDAGVQIVLSRSDLAAQVPALQGAVLVLNLDEMPDEIGAESKERLQWTGSRDSAEDLCYVIYTSGSTGRPKGVAIGHASICNFVQVAAEVYGLTYEDRVYQGMTIAFDFSVEEIWVPWMACATLVPRPGAHNLLGAELHAFLTEHGVTALCCVPTLLATLDEDLPGLRFLLVSGESCPQDLVTRWHRPGRRFLNVYGPTEATVTATWTVVDPDKPVTIGVPLPTYAVVMLEPRADRALPPGCMGEIGIAGVGLAAGYLNKPDLTDQVFIPDFLDIPNNPSGKIYRTGDLGRLNDDGEIEHHGRIDTQVKIRGYRIELAEIESVLLQVPGIAQAVVGVYQPRPDLSELVAYYSLRQDSAPIEPALLYEHLRERLPAYMVPPYLEQLPVVPMLNTGKADRASLPTPRGQRWVPTGDGYEAPVTGIEQLLAELLADTLGVDQISAGSHFFNDLGASSLLMARFTAAIRETASLPPVSMKDIYLHPTVRSLAAALALAAPEPEAGYRPGSGDPEYGAEDGQPYEPGYEPRYQAGYEPDGGLAARGRPRYALCGLLQLLIFIGFAVVSAAALDLGATWTAAGHGVLDIYLRLLAFGDGLLLGLGMLTVMVKWTLIGRWKPRRIRVWSLAYVRFWFAKTMISANPLALLFVGTPLFAFYLRLLGARVGRGATILSKHVPVCTDLVTIGAGAVIRKEAHFGGYRAEAGVIETGAVSIGPGVFIGEHSVLDIGTAMGDGAQLGHASALLPGQAIPAGQCWHGSPAQRAEPGYDYRTVPPARCGVLRRARYSLIRLVLVLTIAAPAAAGLASLQLTHPRVIADLVGGQTRVTSWVCDRDALIIAAVLLFGLSLIGLVLVTTVPRLLSHFLKPGKVYPLYGFHYTMQRVVSRMSNVGFFSGLFGDSSAIVHYLKAIGYRLKPVVQTGSNFGMAVDHEMPTLSRVGTGTMVADGLSFMNAEYSGTSFRVLPVVIGDRNYLGNNIAYPAGGRTGNDCLLATKAMIPIAGPVREGVGLLGSPCFEIPRVASRDRRFDHLSSGPQRRRSLRAKNRHNAATVGLHLLVRFIFLFGMVLVAFCPVGPRNWPGWAFTLTSLLIALVFTFVFFILVERAVLKFRRLRPQYCSIYQAPFWRHERYWKVPSTGYVQLLSGTPFKSAIWRLLGVRIGRRVFDDGCGIVERTLVSIGSYATLNAASVLQCHSMEDGIFKSDYITIGDGCTLGPGAFVHYGTTMGDDSVLDTDAFLMKGETVPPGTWWRGNPATQLAAHPHPAAAAPASTRTRAATAAPGARARRRARDTRWDTDDDL